MSIEDKGAADPSGGPNTLTSLLYLFAFLAVVFLAAAAGGAVTATSVGDWYQTLIKPPLTPAPWVFPVVWNFLYFLMAISAWLVWRTTGSFDRSGPPLAIFGAQLSLNLTWSILFFGLKNPTLAAVEVVILDIAVAGTILSFARYNRLSALLLLPYLAWVLFATYLTIGLAVLN